LRSAISGTMVRTKRSAVIGLVMALWALTLAAGLL
jgi:hypothetical protein